MTLSVILSPLDDRPTSHIEMGRTKLGSPLEKGDVVRISHDSGRTAAFRVDPVDDEISDSIRKNVRINGDAATRLFPSPNEGRFTAERIPAGSVIGAKRVELNPRGYDREDLVGMLRQRQALLHPVHEVYDVSRTEGETKTVEFTVTELGHNQQTVRVTESTEFEFTDAADAPATAPSGVGGSGGGGGGSGGEGGGGGAGGEEDGASVSITPADPDKNFEEDVAGLSEVKRTAQMMLSLFDSSVSREIVETYGESFADRGGGMMLYGPPGCGKTLISEAIAYEAKYNTDIEEEYGDVVFLEVRGSDVVSKYAGESEKNVEAAFDQAHELASDGFAVLFFDEVETLIPDRSDDNLQRHERALTNAFLQQMNDVEDNLLVIGATNMPFSIDPAATRRFPIQQFIPQPEADVMTEVWETSLGKIAERDDVDCRQLGEASVGYTPAEIADRVLGSDLQRELVESVALEDREPIQPDTEFLRSRLAETEPKTVRQYVSSVMKQAQELEGFPEMKTYVEQQAQEFGMLPGTAPDGQTEEP